jgi:lipopolysaccharide transport system ATP-binding protein
MFVRLAFAVIAHVRADILIIDEALAVGDVYFTQKCMRFLKRFKENGTLVFVSHDVNSVINLCDRAVWLDRGRIARQGPAKEVCEAYLGSFYPDADVGDNAGGENVAGRRGGEEFGTGSARIEQVQLLDEAGRPLNLLLAAQRVELRVRCRASTDIEAPIVGFFVKDRLGQYLFGQNSLKLLPGWRRIAASAGVEVGFAFRMPQLASGEYSIGVAIGAGSQEKHVQHHWIHDALHFRSQADPALTGLMALEDLDCRVQDTVSSDVCA